MKNILFIFLILISSNARSAEKASGGSRGIPNGRTALSYGEGTFHGLQGGPFINSPLLRSVGQDADFFAPLGFHLGIRTSYTQDAQISFNGGAPTRGEIYMTRMELGLKVILPVPVLQPWVGGGYPAGIISISNPRTRGNDNFLVLWENETGTIWGHYWHAGIDVMIGPGLGLRAWYQEDRIKTAGFHNLNEAKLDFTHKFIGVGLVGPMF